MNRLARFNTLRFRVILGEAVLVVGIAIIAGLGIAALRRVSDTVSDELQVGTQLARQSNTMVAALFDQIRSAEQFLADGSDMAQLRFRAAGDAAYTARNVLIALPDMTEAQRVNVNQIADNQAQVEAWYAYAHALRDVGLAGSADTRAAADSARALASRLITQLRNFSAEQASSSEAAARVITETASARELEMWFVMVVAIALGTGILVATVRFLSIPLARLVAIARRLADGNLTPVRLGRMPQELTDLGEAMTHLGAQLRELVSDVSAETDKVLAAAGDLSAMSEELAASGSAISTAMVEISDGAQLQVSSLQQSETAAESMRSTARDNVESAAKVADVGTQIHELAERHRNDVESAGRALLDLGALVQTSASQVARLSKLSESVEDFVELIKQVSSQTNLLALNAAIEAARAGEGGQGFAVVANEVRQLADSSQDAAEDATQAIKEVLDQMAQVTTTMATGQRQVQGVETVAQGAAGALQEIITVVAHVRDQATVVEQSARDNLVTVDRIKELLRSVFDAAQAQAASSEEVSASAEEQSASTEEIAAQAGELTQAAERLRSKIQGLRI